MAYDKNTVMSVQQATNAAGYTPALVVDGIIGPKTTAGIKWLQTTSSYTRTDGVLDDQFLANLGITPGVLGYAGAAATTVQKNAPVPVAPQPIYVPPPLPLNVKPPTPSPAPYVPPPPPPSPGPTPKPSPVAKASPIPAAAGAAAGGGIGWAIAGPMAAALGAMVGGIGGWLFGKQQAAMGCEFGAEPTPTTRYFTTTMAALATQPAKFYRYAPRHVVNTMSAWAASQMKLPSYAMPVPVYSFGKWQIRRAGPNVTLFGPHFRELHALFGAEDEAEFSANRRRGHPTHPRHHGAPHRTR